MPYVSDLVGKLVADVDGQRIGRLQDIIASAQPDFPHPRVVALLIKRPGGSILVPYSEVAVLVAPAIPLYHRLSDVTPYQISENDVFLVRDVLDKQIIDTDGVRVVRVNDVELSRVNGCFYVANVDIGTLGLLRRLGLAWVTQTIAGRLGRPPVPPGVISWDDVELVPGDQAMRLRVPGNKISELHPADLAEIISDLSRSEGSRLLESLDLEQLADTLEEVEPEFQASLVQAMPDERVADVLEEMAPDEAADLLAELPEDRSESLLKLMEHDDAEDVRRLLTYQEDTAGGIMTTEFIAVQRDLTAEQVMNTLRENAGEAETIFYVYVCDAGDHLIGVFSLRELILARPDTLVEDFMEQRVVTVHLGDSQNDVAQVIAKYNLLAVPVVDADNRVQGIVTADDALDKIIPTAWKKRLPKLYR
jgi:magnesium transporter